MLTERHLIVLRHLRQEARKTFTQISEETGIPVTTVFDYFHKFKKGAIKKQVSLLDLDKLGLTSSYFILTDPERKLIDFLKHDWRVNSLFQSSKGVIFEAVFSDGVEAEDFAKMLESFDVKDVDHHHILKEMMRESFVPPLV